MLNKRKHVLTVPVLVYRLWRPQHRSKVLYRALVFVVTRIAMLVIRAIEAKRDFVLGLYGESGRGHTGRPSGKTLSPAEPMGNLSTASPDGPNRADP